MKFLRELSSKDIVYKFAERVVDRLFEGAAAGRYCLFVC